MGRADREPFLQRNRRSKRGQFLRFVQQGIPTHFMGWRLDGSLAPPDSAFLNKGLVPPISLRNLRRLEWKYDLVDLAGDRGYSAGRVMIFLPPPVITQERFE